MSINITNFFNRVRNYFIPNSKRNLDITKINKTQLSLPASKFNSIPKVINTCLLYTSPSPRDRQKSRMPSSA
ncbi:Uncharacterised protein [Providencia rettgeri]|nr:Uncharacterised protein [Providencia rettgeri]